MITNDNSRKEIAPEEHTEYLRVLSEHTIEGLCAKMGADLLVFPSRLDAHGEQIGKEHIFRLEDGYMITGNVMGFVGYRGTQVCIRSRFASDGRDYFLHYMLQKVFAPHLLKLDTTSDDEQIFDLLVFMFPHFLNRALQQGLYREYQTRMHNDANLRGRIDINRHIRLNPLFDGRVAYSTRELEYDNPMTELVRHTIEYVCEQSLGNIILSADAETMDNVARIRAATGRYQRVDRQRVIADNLHPFTHPYFSGYADLQSVCLRILRREELKYGVCDDTIRGVLFDGAWLWEAYLATVFRKIGFKHPQNNLRTDGLCLFTDGTGKRYPDFYKENRVLDAKYKRYEGVKVNAVGREDLHQLVTYMYMTKACYGGLVVPLQSREQSTESKKLCGYGGIISLYGLSVDSSAVSYGEFVHNMEVAEQELLDELQRPEE